MSRIALSDGSGWFDAERAVKFEEGTFWNGNNHISRATGSEWDHQALYYTRSGRWVLNEWSQRQGSLESYREIDVAEAAQWLVANECSDELGKLPEDVARRIEHTLGEREV